MRTPEHVIHGTRNRKNVESIKSTGFETEEGRATVSQNLISALSWATQEKSGTRLKEDVPVNEGTILVIQIPKNLSSNFAHETFIDEDHDEKEIREYTSKFQSGRTQLGLYQDKENYHQYLETIKKIKEILKGNQSAQQFLSKHQIKSIRTFLESKTDDPEINSLQKEIIELIPVKTKLTVAPENIIFEIKPTENIRFVVQDLKNKINNFEKIDLKNITKIITDEVVKSQDTKLNATEISEVIEKLVTTTIETEYMSIVRDMYINKKKFEGFDIYNKQEKKGLDESDYLQKLEFIKNKINSNNFDTGLENVNRYLRLMFFNQ